MQHRLTQSAGIAWTIIYAALIIWLYATEPRTLEEIAQSAQVTVGAYEVDQQKFAGALALFREEKFRAARDEWERADPARQDARTQFYIAYGFYREGWGRVYSDDGLFRQGLEAVNRALRLAAGGTLRVDDANLQIHTAAELKAELEEGSERTWSDVNPLRIFRNRK